jgi:autotransporter-associated beta strand protein
MSTIARATRVLAGLAWAGLCLTPDAARAQSIDIPLNLTLQGTNDPAAVLTINIGIDGQAPRPYLFDTGSEIFVAQYASAAFGSVPSSMTGQPQNVAIRYGNGSFGYNYNIVGTPSLTFYPSYTSNSGGITLNSISTSGSPSQFLIGAITSQVNFPFPDGPQPGGYSGGYGIFGAGNFLSGGPGSVLGQSVIPGTTAGYVVAANGQPLSAMNAGNNPQSSTNGPQVSQSVTSCSPCVMVGLTPALLAQFKTVNEIPTLAFGTFANSGAPATNEFPFFLPITITGNGQTFTTSSRVLFDTGNNSYIIGTGIPQSAYQNGGVTLTVSGPAAGSTPSSVTLYNNSDPDTCCNPYYGLPSSVVGTGPESNIGLGFFLNNSMLYNLAGQVTGYTSNFVTDTNITTTPGSPLIIDSNSVPLGLAGIISGSGPVQVVSGGSATLSGTNSFTGATTINAGFLALAGPGSISASSGVSVSNGGIFDISGVGNGSPSGTSIMSLSSTDNAGLVALGANQLILTNARGTFAGTIADGGSYGGSGGSLVLAGGIETLTGANTYTGGTIVLAGTLQMSGAGTLGATTGTATLLGGIIDLGHTTQTQAALYLAGGTLQNGNLNAPISSSGGAINGIGGTASLLTTSGTTYALGANTYTGGTTVNGGVLDVIGSLTDPTVNSGGTLTGTGTVGPTQVNAGGIFAPGNGTSGSSLTVAGNLAFQSGAIYLVQIGSSANVTGTASLNGATLETMFLNGSAMTRQSVFLTASGGINGAFAGFGNINLPAGFTGATSFAGNQLDLNFTAVLGQSGGLTQNQQKVTSTLNSYFNNGGTLPGAFTTLYGLTGSALAKALNQVSGESATGSLQTTFDAMSEFLGVLTDPFMDRGNGVNGATSPTGYADESASAYAATRRLAAERDAYAMFSKASLAKAYQPRWSVWAAGFGGSQSTDGNAALGSNNVTSRIAGTAVGADYLFSPNTIAGFAMAGGGTSFSVNNLGSGRSDLFQAGAYLRHSNGAAYLSAAVAYGWQDVTTDRNVTIAGMDMLHAEFNANAYSGRLEGGYRFVTPWIGGLGITPYAAAQFTTFDLPGYAERALSGTAAFALNYAASSVTDSRSELGIRADKSYPLANGVLTLRGRFAWVHDYDPDRSIAATFQTLPGASFVVNGAVPASEAALTTASAEMTWSNGWSVAAAFEGEFSNVTTAYTGKGVVRYQW